MSIRTRALKVLGKISAEEKFDGKTYQLRYWAKTKRRANELAKGLRGRGYLARIRYVSQVKEYAIFYRRK